MKITLFSLSCFPGERFLFLQLQFLEWLYQYGPHCQKGLWVAVTVAKTSSPTDTVSDMLKKRVCYIYANMECV